MNDQKLKNRIMRRIYGIWFVRQALPLMLGSASLIFISLRLTANRFFVAKVLSNFLSVASTNAWAIPQFITSAMDNAGPQVLFLISASGLIGFYLAVKLLRSIRTIISSQGTLAAGKVNY